MKYYSTRDNSLQKTSMEVIKQGLSAEGGLFVPESIPAVSMEELSGLLKADYRERAEDILSP